MRDWLLPSWCLYPLVGVCHDPLMGRSSEQTNKQTNKQTNTHVHTFLPLPQTLLDCIISNPTHVHNVMAKLT